MSKNLINKELGYIGFNTFIPLLVFLICVINIFYGEKIPVNGGKGWDGYYYFKMAYEYDVSQFFNGEKIGTYYIHRTLPWFLINVFTKIIHHHDVETTFLMAKYLLVVSIATSLFLTHRIAEILKFTRDEYSLLFILLFINAAFLKISGYYIFLTEYYAVTILLASIYFYLEKSISKLIVSTILLNFTWPILFINYYFLYRLLTQFFSNYLPTKNLGKFNNSFSNKILGNNIFVFSILLIYMTILWKSATYIKTHRAGGGENTLNFNNLLYVSGAIINFVIYFLYFRLLVNLLREYLQKNQVIGIWNNQLVSFVVVLIMSILLNWVSIQFSNSNIQNPSSISALFVGRLLRWSSLPLDVYFSSLLYIGLILPIFIFVWKDVKSKILELDLFGFIVVTLLLVLLLNGEARMNIVTWPIMALVVLNYSKFRSVKKVRYIFIIALVLSRFYFKIDAFYVDQINKSEFPNQGYFMYFSPWLSWKGWICVSLIGVIATILVRKVIDNNVSKVR